MLVSNIRQLYLLQKEGLNLFLLTGIRVHLFFSDSSNKPTKKKVRKKSIVYIQV